MTASLPSIRSALLSADDQLAELVAVQRGRFPTCDYGALYKLRHAKQHIAGAMFMLDGMEKSFPATEVQPDFPP